jgi:hypothetical protein
VLLDPWFLDPFSLDFVHAGVGCCLAYLRKRTTNKPGERGERNRREKPKRGSSGEEGKNVR